MRSIVCTLLCGLGCQASAPLPRPSPPALEAPAPAPSRDRSEEIGARALRSFLLQLMPCDRGPGAVLFAATLDERGQVKEAVVKEGSVPGDSATCAASRIKSWRFPLLRPVSGEIPLPIAFPLQPPSYREHGAVLSGSGTIDVEGVIGELLRLRPRVLACFSERAPGGALLLWLRLGAWGRLLGHGIEADSAEHTTPQERACLHRVLRTGEFPNPTAEVEVRYPYVLLP